MKPHINDSVWPNQTISRNSEKNSSDWMRDRAFREKIFCDPNLTVKRKVFYKQSMLNYLVSFFKSNPSQNSLKLDKELSHIRRP